VNISEKQHVFTPFWGVWKLILVWQFFWWGFFGRFLFEMYFIGLPIKE